MIYNNNQTMKYIHSFLHIYGHIAILIMPNSDISMNYETFYSLYSLKCFSGLIYLVEPNQVYKSLLNFAVEKKSAEQQSEP